MPAIVLPSGKGFFHHLRENPGPGGGRETLRPHRGQPGPNPGGGGDRPRPGHPPGGPHGWYEDLDSVASPIIEVLRPIPPSPDSLAILWFGIDWVQGFHSSPSGFLSHPDQYLYRGEIRRSPADQGGPDPGAKDKDILWEVVVPASVPLIVAGSGSGRAGDDVPGGGRTGGGLHGPGYLIMLGGTI